MKLDIFNVVELGNTDKAIIKEKLDDNKYKAEIVDKNGNTKEVRVINENEIRRIVVAKWIRKYIKSH